MLNMFGGKKKSKPVKEDKAKEDKEIVGSPYAKYPQINVAHDLSLGGVGRPGDPLRLSRVTVDDSTITGTGSTNPIRIKGMTNENNLWSIDGHVVIGTNMPPIGSGGDFTTFQIGNSNISNSASITGLVRADNAKVTFGVSSGINNTVSRTIINSQTLPAEEHIPACRDFSSDDFLMPYETMESDVYIWKPFETGPITDNNTGITKILFDFATPSTLPLPSTQDFVNSRLCFWDPAVDNQDYMIGFCLGRMNDQGGTNSVRIFPWTDATGGDMTFVYDTGLGYWKNTGGTTITTREGCVLTIEYDPTTTDKVIAVNLSKKLYYKNGSCCTDRGNLDLWIATGLGVHAGVQSNKIRSKAFNTELKGPFTSISTIDVPLKSNFLYLIGTTSPYDMYAYIDSNLVLIGNTQIDLSDYKVMDLVQGSNVTLSYNSVTKKYTISSSADLTGYNVKDLTAGNDISLTYNSTTKNYTIASTALSSLQIDSTLVGDSSTTNPLGVNLSGTKYTFAGSSYSRGFNWFVDDGISYQYTALDLVNSVLRTRKNTVANTTSTISFDYSALRVEATGYKSKVLRADSTISFDTSDLYQNVITDKEFDADDFVVKNNKVALNYSDGSVNTRSNSIGNLSASGSSGYYVNSTFSTAQIPVGSRIANVYVSKSSSGGLIVANIKSGVSTDGVTTADVVVEVTNTWSSAATGVVVYVSFYSQVFSRVSRTVTIAHTIGQVAGTGWGSYDWTTAEIPVGVKITGYWAQTSNQAEINTSFSNNCLNSGGVTIKQCQTAYQNRSSNPATGVMLFASYVTLVNNQGFSTYTYDWGDPGDGSVINHSVPLTSIPVGSHIVGVYIKKALDNGYVHWISRGTDANGITTTNFLVRMWNVGWTAGQSNAVELRVNFIAPD